MLAGTGFVFPGQGSQHKGMLSGFSDSRGIIRDTVEEASNVLGFDLWELMQQDPDNRLSETSITQPAILTASVAVWRLWLERGGGKPQIMAGHSLGEYSALVCSGVISFPDAVMLVRKRGEFMQDAVPAGDGGMAAIIGLEDNEVIEACVRAAGQDTVNAVNFNAPGQVVIAGHTEAVERAIALCKENGARRAQPLPVSAPFHSPLMQPAAERFAEVLAGINLSAPEIPVLQNYGLTLGSQDTSAIRENLVKQIYNPVPWVDTIRLFAANGIDRVLELGPGKVLSGLIRRIAPDMTVGPVNDDASLEEALI